MKNVLLAAIVLLSVSLKAQYVFRFGVELVEVTPTERVYNFEAEDFQNIIAWQFKMNFDGTKMRFKGIRNPVLDELDAGDFNEPVPGELRSVWLDTDLTPDNINEPTVLYQMVFEVLSSGNTPLCFDENQDFFEFIVTEGSGNFYLSELVIHDDCVSGLSIFLNGTATEDQPLIQIEHIQDVLFQTSGTLSFTSSLNQNLTLYLYDINGKQLVSFNKKEYAEGRHTLQCKPVPTGMYVVKAISEDGKESATKVIAN